MASMSCSADGKTAEKRILAVLETRLSPIIARCVLKFAVSTLRVDLDALLADQVPAVLKEVRRGVNLYASEHVAECMRLLEPIMSEIALPVRSQSRQAPPLTPGDRRAPVPSRESAGKSSSVPITSEADVVLARHAARELCARMGFSHAEAVKAATVVSELARNIVVYAGTGEITVAPWINHAHAGIEIRAVDDGPGIPHLDIILSGRYRSRTGLGLGILGARRLAREFEISAPAGKGTHIVARTARH